MIFNGLLCEACLGGKDERLQCIIVVRGVEEHGLDGFRGFSRIASRGIRAGHACMAATDCKDQCDQLDQRHQCIIAFRGVLGHTDWTDCADLHGFRAGA